MSIIEHRAPPAAAAPPAGADRLRVITAGHVGNIDARLGTSGFDIVAVAENEDGLIDAVSIDEPDAIVVEADLCDSLEHVRDLAPDAVLIVVGDHTPAGALGRIERGVSGTVLAGLLHALVAEGVGAAVVWGLVPALRAPAPVSVPEHVGTSLLSARAPILRDHVVTALHEHGGLVAAFGTVVVTASAALLLTLGAPRTTDRAAPVTLPPAVVDVAPPPAAVSTPIPSPARRVNATRLGAAIGDGRHGQSSGSGTGDHPGHHQTPPADEGSPPQDSTTPSADASRPPGVAQGWDHRPPKDDDNGNKKGWTDNGVPDDLPPGKQGDPPGHDKGHGPH